MINDEHERLALLLEECGEVQHIIGKILRHGYESVNPFAPELNNRELLEKELGDLHFAIMFMCERGDIDFAKISENEEEKRHNINQYLHYNSVDDK